MDDSEIAALLQKVLGDSHLLENVNESEDELIENDVQSDVEDQLVDILEPDENIPPIQKCPQEPDNFTTSCDSRVITVSRTTIRSKSKHCWTTSKGLQ